MTENMQRKRRKPILWIVGGVLLLTIVGFLVFQQREIIVEAAPKASTAVSHSSTPTNLTATGHIQAAERATLSFNTPGRVVIAPVRVGDAVAAGDVLMALDTTELEINLAMAQQNLAIQEANLTELKNGATAAELTAAETAVSSATTYLTQLQAGPRPAEIAVQHADLSVYTASTYSAAASLQLVHNSSAADQIAATRVELAQAESALSQARKINDSWKDENTHRMLKEAEERVAIAQSRLNTLLNGPNTHDQGAAQAELAAAAAQEEAAQVQTNIFLQGGTPEQISAAEAQLAQAQAALDTLQRGASDAQVMMAETAVSQATLDIEAAQDALNQATLKAPFDGVITAVYVTEGSIASGPVIEMLNPDKLEIVLKVSEIDIAQLQEGQTAIVHTETWPTERLESSITRIAPSAIVGESRVNYEIRLALPKSNHPIRVGMTAVAEFIAK
ncbi:MAG: HlyD family efflux transporter periplasmic adaptor subunit [Chloroflexi bacterium]|nr:MAG: HlyD family efflux transporter periplasmic adaptor subunit [Chloroflexota bacterium]